MLPLIFLLAAVASALPPARIARIRPPAARPAAAPSTATVASRPRPPPSAARAQTSHGAVRLMAEARTAVKLGNATSALAHVSSVRDRERGAAAHPVTTLVTSETDDGVSQTTPAATSKAAAGGAKMLTSSARCQHLRVWGFDGGFIESADGSGS